MGKIEKEQRFIFKVSRFRQLKKSKEYSSKNTTPSKSNVVRCGEEMVVSRRTFSGSSISV
jgi:hypothetical protein